MALAEAKQIELLFPAFSISESIYTIFGRTNLRRDLFDQIKNSIKRLTSDLGRSELYEQEIVVFQLVTTALATMNAEEDRLLKQTIRRLLAIGKTLETNAANFAKALSYSDLSLQDAIVYASVVADL